LTLTSGGANDSVAGITQPALPTPQDVIRLYQVLSNPGKTDLERLGACDEIHGRLRTFERQLVAHARDGGSTWDEIAQALEISKQAAHQRFGG
jgi:hypothetical protein